ncbi:VOC family protein [Kribbella shirazensis]|uniref:Putative glyoxalase superfamily protein PhnB n=1 Tax=Kribbella shirazensis TaxID=1105143 RepID=A0A7X5VH59_9ACTN|nr:VOC family protein [Kribbella shirazensis]NIK60427.1 putative glyoxalase superfamily protein PhnB [Kribbella shirazensis]
MNTTQEMTQQQVIGVWPALIYRDGQAALTFLTEGLGFRLVASYPGDAEGSIAHAELTWPTGGGVMIGSADAKAEPDEFTALAGQNQSIYLVHDHPDPVFGRAIGAGAVVVRGLEDTDYGSRGFTVRDPEGNLWSVGTYPGAH